jgi:hypothetical protein
MNFQIKLMKSINAFGINNSRQNMLSPMNVSLGSNGSRLNAQTKNRSKKESQII